VFDLNPEDEDAYKTPKRVKLCITRKVSHMMGKVRVMCLFYFSNLVNEWQFLLVFYQIAEGHRTAVFSALCFQGITFHLVAEWVY
jgi:hypothetical protein